MNAYGVNTAIYSPSGSSAGIGFAVPVDIVNRVVPQIIRYGRVMRPQLGVQIAEDDVSQRLGLPGVLILQTEPGSGAETAGLRGTRVDARGRPILGDIIVGIDSDRVEDADDLMNALEKHQAGDTVTVTVVRGDERLRVPVTVQAPQ